MVGPTPQFVDSPKAKQNIVIGSAPKEGTAQKLGATVTLKVASGSVKIADVTGQTCATATQTAPEAHAQADLPEPGQPGAAEGQGVRNVSRAPVGTDRPQDSTITIFISNGPSQMPLPNVVGEVVRPGQARPAARRLQGHGHTAGRVHRPDHRTTSSSRRRRAAPHRPARLAPSTITVAQVQAERPELRRTAGIDVSEVVRLRVAVLSGGRSSEHEISLASGASGGGGPRPGPLRRGRRHHRAATAPGSSRRRPPRASGSRSTRARTRAASSPAPAARSARPGRSARSTWSCRCCTAPTARTARCRGCSRCSACPYVGSGVLASALTMDKAMVKVVLGANGIATARSVHARGAHRARHRRRGDARGGRDHAAVLRQAGPAGLERRHQQGDRHRRPRAGARPGLPARLQGADRGDGARDGDRVRRARHPRPARERPRPAARERGLVRLRRQVRARRHGPRGPGRHRPGARRGGAAGGAGLVPGLRSARAWPGSTCSSPTRATSS